MKQIFDWMREQLEEDIEWYETHGINKDFNRGIIGEANKGISLVDEAEAKWESDCCEWKHREHYVNCFCKCYGIMVEHDMAIGFKFCPYCGKPIKISEVE